VVLWHKYGNLPAGKRPVLDRIRSGCRALLLAGTPIREPVVQHGPIVMNASEKNLTSNE
jgi:redox-sensitive bicupin YhaK (pirin superfamily)